MFRAGFSPLFKDAKVDPLKFIFQLKASQPGVVCSHVLVEKKDNDLVVVSTTDQGTLFNTQSKKQAG